MVVLHASDPSQASNELAGIEENRIIAKLLSEIAELLVDQHASDFRVRAYVAAAETISKMPSPIRDTYQIAGIEGLVALPTIGHSIASLIESYLKLQCMPLLDRLRGEANAETFFTSLPGVGHELSRRIYEHLHVETLPELYAATQQGRLEQVPGLGCKRIRTIKKSLLQRIGKPVYSLTKRYPEADRSVSVDELLDIDAEYRKKADAGLLIKIAPLIFNPGKVAWLPILHTERSGRHYSALYSNSARAHDLTTTHDWVIIYRDDPNSHGRWTVITARFGILHGCRIVCGREDECESLYRPQKMVGNIRS